MQVLKNSDNGRNLNVDVCGAAIDNMQQEISFSQFFERCPKGADQFLRKIPNKPYRIGDDDFAILREPQASARRVQGFEQSVLSRYLTVRQDVEQCGLAGVRIAHERNDGESVPISPGPTLVLLASKLCQL